MSSTKRCNQPPIDFLPHFKAHVLSPNEVALLSEYERFALRGEEIAALAPLIDGSRTADEIVEELEESLDAARVYYVLDTLMERGHVGPKLPTAAPDLSTWWSASTEDAIMKAKLASTALISLSSIGLDNNFLSAVEQSLCAEGLQVLASSGKDVATIDIVFTDDYLRPELAQRVADAQEQGRALLPVRPVGRFLWFGPVSRSDSPVDWPALAKRLGTNRAADVTVLASNGQFPLLPNSTPGPIADLARSYTTVISAQLAAGKRIESIEDAIWIIDTLTLETRSHKLPQCNAYSGPSPQRFGHEAINLEPTLKMFRADGGHRVCSPDQTLSALERHVSPITGVVPDLHRRSNAIGMRVYETVQTKMGRNISHHQNRLLGSPTGAEGKGQSDVQARVSCIAEAIERYSCGFSEDIITKSETLEEIGVTAIHPNQVMLYSQNQFDRRLQDNSAAGLFNQVPAPFDPLKSVGWTPLWSLTNQVSRWLPSGLCYFNYDVSEKGTAPWFSYANSNGCASGNTLEEAILQGLFEVVERDAAAIWWYNRVQRPSVDLESFNDAFFAKSMIECERLERTLYVLDLTNDLDIPVFVAVSARGRDGGMICFGLGCHLEPRLAISRALTELTQMLVREDEFESLDRDDKNFDLAMWCNEATLNTERYTVPLDIPQVAADKFVDSSSNDVLLDIRHCIDVLKRAGLEILVLNHTRPDVGFPTARVVVPGLRHFWKRFAPGRLYDVPAALGWQDQPHAEKQLNPIGFIW